MSYAYSAKSNFSNAANEARNGNQEDAIKELADGLQNLAQAIVNIEHKLNNMENELRYVRANTR